MGTWNGNDGNIFQCSAHYFIVRLKYQQTSVLFPLLTGNPRQGDVPRRSRVTSLFFPPSSVTFANENLQIASRMSRSHESPRSVSWLSAEGKCEHAAGQDSKRVRESPGKKRIHSAESTESAQTARRTPHQTERRRELTLGRPRLARLGAVEGTHAHARLPAGAPIGPRAAANFGV